MLDGAAEVQLLVTLSVIDRRENLLFTLVRVSTLVVVGIVEGVLLRRCCRSTRGDCADALGQGGCGTSTAAAGFKGKIQKG